ncbi:hypothetical protein [Oceanicaulis alexandrii]|uniref:hypothetical protein n=1 Tax=Oceanicaulis alexandrii TaxID=153233 RepID=UPI002356AFA4|nr:hypothetical protein [Oceanicaulis alexandrii]
MAEGVTLQNLLLISLIESLPSVMVVICGFFIFHHLASRRQKRDEFFYWIKELRSHLDRTLTVADKAWKLSGKEAIESGAVHELRAALKRMSYDVNQISEYDAKYSDLKKPFLDLKRTLDEFQRPESSGGSTSYNVADESRSAFEDLPAEIQNESGRFSSALMQAHWNKYQ